MKDITIAPEGKCFRKKGTEEDRLYCTMMLLGKGDSLDNYDIVDLAEKEAYDAEIERLEQIKMETEQAALAAEIEE